LRYDPQFKISPSPSSNEGAWVPILRGVFVGISTVLAVAVPDFAFLVGMVGALCLGLVAFIFPPLMRLKLAQVQKKIPSCRHWCEY
jgi:hypothetical protein